MYATTVEAEQIVRKMESYGVQCDGEVVGHEYHEQVSYDSQMTLGEFVRAGGRITRVRILTGNWGGRKMADVSYIHGVLPSGKIVPIHEDYPSGVFFYAQRGIPGSGMKAQFIEWAKEHKVFAKGCGLLDEGNWSVLHGS